MPQGGPGLEKVLVEDVEDRADATWSLREAAAFSQPTDVGRTNKKKKMLHTRKTGIAVYLLLAQRDLWRVISLVGNGSMQILDPSQTRNRGRVAPMPVKRSKRPVKSSKPEKR